MAALLLDSIVVATSSANTRPEKAAASDGAHWIENITIYAEDTLGEISLRLALYAHYSPSDKVALYVLFYLRKLRELGFRICFISNSPIPASGEAELREICEKVIQRGNTGYDFGMWQQAIASYRFDDIDELLLTNSSIVGPLRPLKALWEHPTAKESDFWGLTDNDEFARHLQSYFIVFQRTVLQHPGFRRFWSSVQPIGDRNSIIQRYEVGLTRELQKLGLRWSALFPQKNIHVLFLRRREWSERLRYRIGYSKLPRNSTMRLPDLLLECGMPFLKTRLFAAGEDLRMQVSAELAMRLAEASNLPEPVVHELRLMSLATR